MIDPTRIDIDTDPLTRRMVGTTHHGYTPFDVPIISEIGDNLWQGGCQTGLVLPRHIRHLVSLYPWERYTIEHEVDTELYVKVYDSEEEGFANLTYLARYVNRLRNTGPVLVHCQAGLNRSSLLAARALHLDDHRSGPEIIAHLREFRSPAVLCNPAFEKRVAAWTPQHFIEAS